MEGLLKWKENQQWHKVPATGRAPETRQGTRRYPQSTEEAGKGATDARGQREAARGAGGTPGDTLEEGEIAQGLEE